MGTRPQSTEHELNQRARRNGLLLCLISALLVITLLGYGISECHRLFTTALTSNSY